MPESLQQTSQSKLPPLFPLLQCKSFVVYGLTCGIALSLIICHVTLSPSILMGASGITPMEFSVLFGSNAVVILIANLINHKLMNKVSSHTMLKTGLVLMMLSGVIMSLMTPSFIIFLIFYSLISPTNKKTPNWGFFQLTFIVDPNKCHLPTKFISSRIIFLASSR